jgi:hypothetical protein
MEMHIAVQMIAIPSTILTATHCLLLTGSNLLLYRIKLVLVGHTLRTSRVKKLGWFNSLFLQLTMVAYLRFVVLCSFKEQTIFYKNPITFK